MDDAFKLDEKTHQRIYKEIECEQFSFTKPVDNPRVIITGGQPGSGKSRILDLSKAEFHDRNVVLINGDEYRQYHPMLDRIKEVDDKRLAEFTDPDCRIWTKRLFDKAIETRRNIIFESTLRDPGPISETMKVLRDQGYHLKIKIVATPRWSSITAIFARYEDQKATQGYGRWSAFSSHDAGFEGLPRTVGHIENNRLVDEIQVYSRSLQLLYENDLRTPKGKSSALIAIDKERDRSPNSKELIDFQNRWLRILELMMARTAPRKEIESAREIKNKLEQEFKTISIDKAKKKRDS